MLSSLQVDKTGRCFSSGSLALNVIPTLIPWIGTSPPTVSREGVFVECRNKKTVMLCVMQLNYMFANASC